MEVHSCPNIVKSLQKLQKFLMPMSCGATTDNLSSSHIQSGKQSQRAVSDVIVGDPFKVTQAHRQNRLSALQSLALTFLVNAQDHRLGRRIEVKPDDIAHFLSEERVIGQVEALAAMGL